jgi:hypothetical protein
LSTISDGPFTPDPCSLNPIYNQTCGYRMKTPPARTALLVGGGRECLICHTEDLLSKKYELHLNYHEKYIENDIF